MSTTDTTTCPDCGATYPASAFAGMCPHCLLSDAFPEARDPENELSGTHIDRFTLIEKIGEGGMGSVWRARQDEPIQREVALKLIKLGMDTSALVARFESERQVLATLDHASIAKIFDAGTASDGRPYYAMELVDGLPITEYCAKHALPIKERLALFRHVCTAVQHAHEKGIIHRDLKPSNILVSGHAPARLKLIDFGVAKSVSPAVIGDTLFTQAGQILGTPGYMSPEQADGMAEVDTRADVYSLGAIFYELISDAPPFSEETLREAGLLEIIRIIKEVEPPKPSTHSGGRPSDLDWIALKAIAKKPDHRYQTPTELAADLDRFLQGKTVSASAPRLRAKIGKFLRRHPIATAAIAIALPLAATTTFLLDPKDPPAAAKKATVTTTADTGPGSLRAIIAEVPARSEIFFAPALEGETIQLAGDPLLIDKNLTIDATSLSALTIDAGGQSGIFVIKGESLTVHLSGLTLSGGLAEDGGAIENHALLTLRRCTLKNNRAKTGGAISNRGVIYLYDCLFTDNRAEENGGALYQSDSAGAGAFGVWHHAFARRCTFARNHARYGGAIYYAWPIRIWNSTFTENTGSALYKIRGAENECQLLSCTITQNTGERAGGVDADTMDFVICNNTLILANTPKDVTPGGPSPLDAGSLIGTGTDPQLAPLGDHGGRVPTMPPLPGSPLIDTGSPAFQEDTDARGFTRLIGDAYDVGAVEFDPARDTP